MYYEKSKEKTLDLALFKNPTQEYRDTPFWAWNCTLCEKKLRRQIRHFKKMGFGGFHMHARTGLATPYLSPAFMDSVCACVDEAKENGMLAHLYDEDRYSSGQAGGFATKNPRFARRGLYFSTVMPTDLVEKKEAYKKDQGAYLLARYDIELDENGRMLSFVRLADNEPAAHTLFIAFSRADGPSPWFNDSPQADQLSFEATDEFVRITYDAYHDACGKEYGKTVPSIFTDEPSVRRFVPLADPFDPEKQYLPKDRSGCAWTYDFEESYLASYGADILDTLPEIFLDYANGALPRTRYFYFDFIAERFSLAYMKRCADRAERDGIALTGHVLGENELYESTGTVSDILRAYRYMQLPGIDILCNCFQPLTALQCRSVVRQYGKDGMLSELYGVNGYNFDMRYQKYEGDWQAALGVTLRVPHLAFLSMEGRSKRDYPASYNYQSPWSNDYKKIADHFARINTVMTRGKSVCRVAMIHPNETAWLTFGANTLWEQERAERQWKFRRLSEILLRGQIDFDFISEALLPSQLDAHIDGSLKVGEMTYDTVIVSGCMTLRKTTVDALTRLCESGGRVVIVGEKPRYESLEENTESLQRLLSLTTCTDADWSDNASNEALFSTLEDARILSLTLPDGKRPKSLLYGLHEDGDLLRLFIANERRDHQSGTTDFEEVTAKINGIYRVTLMDTLNGKVTEIPHRHEDGKTFFAYRFYTNTSALFTLEKTETQKKEPLLSETCKQGKKVALPDRVDYTLDSYADRRNVLLLDRAEYSLDGKEFYPEEEIMRLDAHCRKIFGLKERDNHAVQPWVKNDAPMPYKLSLRFTFTTEIDLSDLLFVVEQPEKADILLDGQRISNQVVGYFVDESIKTIALPPLSCGTHTVTLTVPYGEKAQVEWCYLLGKFGVHLHGSEKILTEQAKQLSFGSVTEQGLPFYGHNVTYRFPLTLDESGNLVLRVPHYRAHLLRVLLDGNAYGTIDFAPYELEIKNVSAGKHVLEITAVGSLTNTFGPVHFAKRREIYETHPRAWTAVDDDYCEGYCLHDVGILEKPTLEIL